MDRRRLSSAPPPASTPCPPYLALTGAEADAASFFTVGRDDLGISFLVSLIGARKRKMSSVHLPKSLAACLMLCTEDSTGWILLDLGDHPWETEAPHLNTVGYRKGCVLRREHSMLTGFDSVFEVQLFLFLFF